MLDELHQMMCLFLVMLLWRTKIILEILPDPNVYILLFIFTYKMEGISELIYK